jgi:hypothetical protein
MSTFPKQVSIGNTYFGESGSHKEQNQLLVSCQYQEPRPDEHWLSSPPRLSARHDHIVMVKGNKPQQQTTNARTEFFRYRFIEFRSGSPVRLWVDFRGWCDQHHRAPAQDVVIAPLRLERDGSYWFEHTFADRFQLPDQYQSGWRPTIVTSAPTNPPDCRQPEPVDTVRERQLARLDELQHAAEAAMDAIDQIAVEMVPTRPPNCLAARQQLHWATARCRTVRRPVGRPASPARSLPTPTDVLLRFQDTNWRVAASHPNCPTPWANLTASDHPEPVSGEQFPVRYTIMVLGDGIPIGLHTSTATIEKTVQQHGPDHRTIELLNHAGQRITISERHEKT